ncbi:MAG: tetratricopeptide repeat protein [Cyanobacteria bacterium]|nr:tetratricopeptide repeat protein [Cyanobacteriota bacterium]
MPELPFDPPKEGPRRGPVVAASDTERAARRYTHRDIIAMYSSLRLDHLRYLEKCGLVKPAIVENERLYGFSDLTALRQIAGELQQGTPFRAVVRTLQSSQSGQLTFDFRLDAHPARIIELKPRTPPPLDAQPPGTQGTIPLGTPGTLGTIGTGAFGPLSEAEQYFLMGSLLDDGTPERVEEAVKAYRRALEQDPDLVAALINLANIRYSRDELAEAQALYERAITLDDSYFEAHFNLGNIHHDHGRYAEAEASYRIALALNHNYADAHFYLAVTLEKMGRSIDARTHWKAYERLAPNGEWVELAREFSD